MRERKSSVSVWPPMIAQAVGMNAVRRGEWPMTGSPSLLARTQQQSSGGLAQGAALRLMVVTLTKSQSFTLRQPGVPSMFDSLEVKVLYPT
jgi:hypothetical protein